MILRLVSMILIVLAMAAASFAVWHKLHPDTWAKNARRVAVLAAVSFVGSVGLFFFGQTSGNQLAILVGMTGTALVLLTTLLVFGSIPAWVAWFGLGRLMGGSDAANEGGTGGGEPDPSRRAFLQRSAGAVPLAAAAVGPVGMGSAVLTTALTEVTIPVPDLDPRLDGLTILHMTDVHLGPFINPDQIAAVVAAAKDKKPDLVVFTGDVADDFSKLGKGLKVAHGLKAPLGVHACIGNHEIYRGRAEAERIYKEAGVALHSSSGVALQHNGATLWLAGANDPARLGQDTRPFLQKSIARAVKERPADAAATIVLSHRPEGVEAAAAQGAVLTLSGHTHGGQFAAFGRSVFEPFIRGHYLLGHYALDATGPEAARRGQGAQTHLYTSAGLGHWFPFRIGCPCEGALVTLKRTEGKVHVAQKRVRQIDVATRLALLADTEPASAV